MVALGVVCLVVQVMSGKDMKADPLEGVAVFRAERDLAN